MVRNVMTDAEYMERALDLAERGRGRTSPNPMVGAVVVADDGTIVGQGFHERAGGPHAEIRALDEAGTLASGASLFCSLEPCCHVGRTGPCVERIAAAGITRVVAAIEDPNPVVAGRGFHRLRERGLQVEVGVGAERAARMNAAYLTFMRTGYPFVILKAATSLDNRIAERTGARTTLTSVESRRHAHAVRAEVDAIAVGSETVLVDDPLLTVREVRRDRPLVRVVFDRRLRTPPAARLFSTLDAGPVIIITTPEQRSANDSAARALEHSGARIEPIRGGSLRGALKRLAALDVTSFLIEGGPTLQAAAWAEGLVDVVQLYVAPVTIGPDGVPWLDAGTAAVTALKERRVIPLGPDVFMEGYGHRSD
jgi:diaminohydroxyphosphoribosylaminopyrimidine deaminase/5-amino-6-(5-phosphoribosylamino)uracil reductase